MKFTEENWKVQNEDVVFGAGNGDESVHEDLIGDESVYDDLNGEGTVHDDLNGEALIRDAQSGNPDAKELLLVQNEGLIRKVVTNHMRAYVGLHPLFTEEDLTVAAQIGFLHAIDKYDFKKGVKLSTYAVIWMEQHVKREIQKYQKGFSLPENVLLELNKLRKVKAEFENEAGFPASAEELAELTGFSVKKVRRLLEADSLQSVVSIDRTIDDSDTDNASVLEVISDRNSANPEELFAEKELREVVQSVLSELDERAKSVLVWSTGYNRPKKLSYREIGRILGLSQERVRQILQETCKLIRTRYAAKFDGYVAA